jgi:hypothetical protein
MKNEALEPINFAKIHPHWKQIYLSTLPSLPLKDILAYFKPADVLAQFQPEDVLARFKPADLLAQLKPEDIENYLTHLKQSPRATTAKAKTKTKKRGN